MVVKFVVAFPAGTAIAADDGATLTFDYKPAISFGQTSDKTLEANHIYIVTKTFGSSSFRVDMGNAPAGCQLVDLGLPSEILWANMNIGATSETDYGKYFAWGETTGYTSSDSHDFNVTNYTWINGSNNNSPLTKYNTDANRGTVDDKTELEEDDDAAHAIWGGGWRMPNDIEFEELIDNTTQTWETINGVAGTKFTSKTDVSKYIFLPAGGDFSGTSSRNAGSEGAYWSSSLMVWSSTTFARFLKCTSAGANVYACSRTLGLLIRAVQYESGTTLPTSNSGGSFSGNLTTEDW